MATIIYPYYCPEDSKTYYYWDNNNISFDITGNESAVNPYRPEIKHITSLNIIGYGYCDLYSDGTFYTAGTTKPHSSAITAESRTVYEIDYEDDESTSLTENDYEKEYGRYMNDGNYSAKIVADPRYNFGPNDNADSEKITNFIDKMGVKNEDASLDITQSTIYQGLLASKNLLPPKNDDLFTRTFRFGYYNLEAPLSKVKEYLFFTRPDLNILIPENDLDIYGIKSLYEKNSFYQLPARNTTWYLNPGLLTPFWQDMIDSKTRIIKCLQSSFYEDNDMYGTDEQFIHLLANQVNTNLEIPELSSDGVETSTNRYGTTIFYRGSSEPSDDGLSFSLEFKDTKWLDVYYFFRAYEEYETAKHLGTTVVKPEYIRDKILYDQFSIYKIVVDLDMETILYWGKYYGVTPMSLPRDTFSTDTFDNGISYTIQFKAQFYEDMKPEILQDFNKLTKPIFGKVKNSYSNESDYASDPSGTGYNRVTNYGPKALYDLRPYNPILGRVDNRPAVTAHIQKIKKSTRAKNSPNGYVYKLHWRGVDRY